MSENFINLCTVLQGQLHTLTTDNLIAIFGAFIAVLAFGLTIYQAHLTRHHNRVSVRPHLYLHIEADQAGVKLENGFSIDLVLGNNGIGPAIIKKISAKKGVQKDGVFFLKDTLCQIVDEVEKKFINENFGKKTLSAKVLGSDQIIAADSKLIIAHISVSPCSEQAGEEYMKGLKSLGILIEYESFYKEKFKETY